MTHINSIDILSVICHDHFDVIMKYGKHNTNLERQAAIKDFYLLAYMYIVHSRHE